jgi:hypothetical protein
VRTQHKIDSIVSDKRIPNATFNGKFLEKFFPTRVTNGSAIAKNSDG